jgi:hypothetical protein
MSANPTMRSQTDRDCGLGQSRVDPGLSPPGSTRLRVGSIVKKSTRPLAFRYRLLSTFLFVRSPSASLALVAGKPAEVVGP